MRLRMNQAIAEAIATEMRTDPAVVVWGEDVAEAGGVFKATVGLAEEFGPDRVRDTPISEMGFLGAAAGAAAGGLRPVVEIMFIEFLGVALDQLVTEAALLRYLSAGKCSVPLTVRASAGAGLGFGSQHSQTLERWLIGTPGLKVAVASGARSAYEITRAAIHDDGPVMVIEPRSLYASRDEIDPDAPVPPLCQAEVVRSGGDITILTAGSTVAVAVAAAEELACEPEIIDLRCLWPWDSGQVMASVGHTGRLLIVEENPRGGGWGAHIAAHVATEAFSSLVAPVGRVTCPDVPVPFSPELEARFVPTADEVVAQADSLVSRNEVLKPWWVRERVLL